MDLDVGGVLYIRSRLHFSLIQRGGGSRSEVNHRTNLGRSDPHYTREIDQWQVVQRTGSGSAMVKRKF